MITDKLIALVFVGLGAAGCSSQEEDYGTFEVQLVNRQFVANGVIDRTTPALIKAAIANNPDVSELVLKWVPGSADDEANLRAARMVRNAGLTTIVPEEGIVASGGTDLFLAGAERIVGPGACVGVHSWASGNTLGVGTIQGRDVHRDSEEHKPYLNYYSEIGIDRDFYWFTLSAADANGMHWMSNAEIERFDMATEPLTTVEVNAQRCDGEA